MASFPPPVSGTTNPVNVGPDQPIDDVIASLIQTVARKGKGFALSLASAPEQEARGAVTIEVKELAKARDEWTPPADYRAHVLTTAQSFVDYAKKYGTPEKSLVFFHETGAAVVIDDQVGRGQREVIRLPLPTSKDWNEWQCVLNKKLDHKTLLQFLLTHEANLSDPAILMAMSSVKATATVNFESDIQSDEKTNGVIFKATAGEALVKFPKRFGIHLPVLESDEGGESEAGAEIRLEVMLPDNAMEKVGFTLYCSTWRAILKSRIEAEGRKIGDLLDGWTVVHGTYGTVDHEAKE
jgi:hypothetical protein